MWSIRLKPRCRIRKCVAAVYAEFVAGPCAAADSAGKIPIRFAREWMEFVAERDIDGLRFRRPNTKVRFLPSHQLRADGITPASFGHAVSSRRHRALVAHDFASPHGSTSFKSTS